MTQRPEPSETTNAVTGTPTPPPPPQPGEEPAATPTTSATTTSSRRGRRARSSSATTAPAATTAATVPEDPVRDRFGGVNLGACLFGWIVAVGMSVILTGVVGAVVSAVGAEDVVAQSDAQREAGTIGISTAVVLLVLLMVGYYAGGYVAGRMSRFDGGRQGVAVWVIGLLFSILAGVLGWAFGDDYNVSDRVDLPRVHLSADELGWRGLVAAAAVLLGTLVAAWLGGLVGRRYHAKVDKAVSRAARG